MSYSSLLEEEIILADWTHAIKRSVLQDMLVETSRPDILSFALGLPAAELFPVDAYMQAIIRVLTTDPLALQYGPPRRDLKKHIVTLMSMRGVHCKEEQVFLTAGAQQGLNLLTRLLLDSGGTLLIEEMTYTGFQQVIGPFKPRLLTVRTDLETGMDVDAVEALLENGARPAFIYTVTDGHNPLGVSMAVEKRMRLTSLARRYRVPIVEDDPYGFLNYESAAPGPLRAFDDEWVFYVGSFSKILAPALRTGWIILPEFLIPKLSIIKEATDIDTSTFSQRAISSYLDSGHLISHLARLRSEYGARRDAMLDALEKYFPGDARWQKPTSGVYVWVELPGGSDTIELLKLAIEMERVAFIPGQAFASKQDDIGRNCMRLNFSNCSTDRIVDGIARLARVLKATRRIT